MYFDYTRLTKVLSKDKICFDYLDHISSNSYGVDTYEMKSEHDKIIVKYNEETSLIDIRGNFPYFLNGHNFRVKANEFNSGVYLASSMLGFDIMECNINSFEYGTTLEIPFKTKEIFNSHYSIPYYQTTAYTYGKTFVNGPIGLKIYDQNKRLKTNVDKLIRIGLESAKGYNPKGNYLRLESIYKKPERTFDRFDLTLNEIVNPEFVSKCRMNLIKQYKSIRKMKNQCLTKKPNSAIIPLMVLKELEELLPLPVGELIKNKINAIPEAYLNDYDKKARKSQIKQYLNTIETKESQYNLIQLIESNV